MGAIIAINAFTSGDIPPDFSNYLIFLLVLFTGVNMCEPHYVNFFFCEPPP